MKKRLVFEIGLVVALVGVLIGGGFTIARLQSRCQTAEENIDKYARLYLGYMYVHKITQYRQERGQYPESLRALVPDYISAKYLDGCEDVWTYTPDVEDDTFQFVGGPGEHGSVNLMYSPDFYGIYNKDCVAYALKKRSAPQGKGEPCEPADD